MAIHFFWLNKLKQFIILEVSDLIQILQKEQLQNTDYLLFQSRNIICPVAPSHPVPTLEPGTPDIFVHKHTKIFVDEHTLPQDDTH